MTRRRRHGLALLLALVAVACANDGRRATEPSGDRSAILTAAIEWVVHTPQALVPGRPIGAVDVLDHFASGDFLTGDPDGVPLAIAERQAVEGALSPIPVRWVREEGETCVARTGIELGTTIDPRIDITTVPVRVTVLMALPRIDRDTATVRHELTCGPCCVAGSTIVLARGPDRGWVVTGTTGGFIS